MPHYTIELMPLPEEAAGSGILDQETGRFANLGEALQRARELYRWRSTSAKGFRIFNAAGEFLHVWMPPS